MPKENMHYTCIAYLTIDSIMEIDKKYFLQVYLEECKYKVKKRQMSSDWESEYDTVSKICWL